MVHFIDRRLNPKDKSLGNRRRFLRRVRKHIKQSVHQSVRTRGIANVDKGKKVCVPADGLREPTLHNTANSGRRERVVIGNREYLSGDKIKKPPEQGGRGTTGVDYGEGNDDFLFVVSRDEFLDIFFEDLELPDLIKRSLKEIQAYKSHRAGFSITGSPTNISIQRTMRNALGRRLALRRPRDAELRVLREEIFDLETISSPNPDQRLQLTKLHAQMEKLLHRQRVIAYIDPLDVRYKYFDKRPEPNANAVMFCLMDVSASMGEREKDLAKRFFVLLHLFLRRRYDKIDLVFIRHTHNAQIVNEETFFQSTETGGTVVSTALTEMKRAIEERYSPSEWNIYAAQASDGENFRGDSARCIAVLNDELMKLCQYFAYIEIVSEAEAAMFSSDENGVELWRAYRQVALRWPNFAMKRIARPEEIYPVFRELFARRPAEAAVDA